MDTTNLRILQATLPWGAHEYSAAFRARTDPHRDAGHALVHLTKCVGWLVGVATGAVALVAPNAAPKLADVAICAARLANTYPGRPIELTGGDDDGGGTWARDVVLAGRLAQHLGRLADVLDAYDHPGGVVAVAAARRCDAVEALDGMVRSAAALADVWCVDLDAAIAARIAEKFPAGPPCP
jgi:hypothetical protein